MPVHRTHACDPSELICKIDNQGEKHIKNAIACMEWMLSQNNIDTEMLSKAYHFICYYLEGKNRFDDDIKVFKGLVSRIDTRIQVTKGALDEDKLKRMIEFSQLLTLLRYRYPDSDNSDVVTHLLNTFQSNLQQTTEVYLDIPGAADFLHRFRSLFRLHGNFGEDLSSVNSFFYQFKAIRQRLGPSNYTQFNFSNNVILDLYAFLDCFLDECSPLKNVTSTPSVNTFMLSNTIKREAFSLVNRDKKEYFLRFLLHKWNYNKEKSSAECKRNPQFCHQVTKMDVLPYKMSPFISEEFIPTICSSENENNTLHSLLAESYQAVKDVYGPIFGLDAFSKKNFKPEIYIFPNKHIYEQYGYELFGFQTNNGGQAFISDLKENRSCRLAIYQRNEEPLAKARQYFNLPHELAHCYEGAASLQSHFGNVNILPDSIRESVPQYIQIGVLKNSNICKSKKFLRYGGLDQEVLNYAQNASLIKGEALLSDILNQPTGSRENYYEATLLAAYLVERNRLKEVIACTDGKDERAESYPCYVKFIKQNNKDFLSFLNREVIENSLVTVPSVSQASDLLEAIRTQDLSHLNCLLDGKYKGVNINQIRFPNKNTPLYEAIDAWLRLKNKKTGEKEKALTLIWILFLKGAQLRGILNSHGQSLYDLIDDQNDRALMYQYERDAKKKQGPIIPVEFPVETSTSVRTTFLASRRIPVKTTLPFFIESTTIPAIEGLISTPLILSANESKKIKHSAKDTRRNKKGGSGKNTAISTEVISIPLAERLLIAASLGVGDGLIRAIFQLIQREKPHWKEKRIARFLLISSQVFITASLRSTYSFFLSYPTKISISEKAEPWFATGFYFATSVSWDFMMLCIIESLNTDNFIWRRFVPGCAYLSDHGLNRIRNFLSYFFIFYPWLIVSFTENEWTDKLCSLVLNTLASLITYVGTQEIYLRLRHSHASRKQNGDFLEEGHALLTRNAQDKAMMPVKVGMESLKKALNPIRHAERYVEFFGDLYRNLESICEKSLETSSEACLELSDLSIRYPLMKLYLEKMERNLFYVSNLSKDKKKNISFCITALKRKINSQLLSADKIIENRDKIGADVDNYFLTSDELTDLRQTFLDLSTLLHGYSLTLEENTEICNLHLSLLQSILTISDYLQKNLFDDKFYSMFCNKIFVNDSDTDANISILEGFLNQAKQWVEKLENDFIAFREASIREKAMQYLKNMKMGFERIIDRLHLQKKFFKGNRAGEVTRCCPLSKASFDLLQSHLEFCEKAIGQENIKVKVSPFTFKQLNKIKENLLSDEVKQFCDQSFSREEIEEKTSVLQALFYSSFNNEIPCLQDRIKKFSDIEAMEQGIHALASINKILKFSLSTLGGAISFQRGYQKGISGEKVDRPNSRCHLSQLFKPKPSIQITIISKENSNVSRLPLSERV